MLFGMVPCVCDAVAVGRAFMLPIADIVTFLPGVGLSAVGGVCLPLGSSRRRFMRGFAHAFVFPA